MRRRHSLLLGLAAVAMVHCATGITDFPDDDDDGTSTGTTTGAGVGTGGGAECLPPTSSCGTECADLQADPRHCGECFHACDPLGTPCIAGECGTGTGAGTSTGTGAGTSTGTGAGTGTGTGAGTGTGTGTTACNPLSPAIVCGAGQHCVPQDCPSSSPSCLGPTGYGTQDYLGCWDSSECADIFECVNDGYYTWCLQWCRIGANDCAAYGYDCVSLATPGVCIGAQEWGVCY